MNDKKLPTFIVIGPGRSGTTWIYEMLRSHPDVCLAAGTKETMFFDQEYHRGIAWYASFFSKCDECKAIGEISNAYIYSEKVAARIANDLPNVKLIVCLRNPVARLESVYHYRLRRNTTSGSMRDMIREDPSVLEDSLYARKLEKYLEYFSRERICILFHQDMESSPEDFLHQLFSTIGVDPEFFPEGYSQRINPASEARSRLMSALSSRVAEMLRSVGMYQLLDFLKRNRVVRWLVLKEKKIGEGGAIDESLASELADFYRDDILKLEKISGRDLSEWRRGQTECPRLRDHDRR